MHYLLVYLLKCSIGMAVIFVFYFLVLRSLTFYQWNRFFLTGGSIACFIIPFINLNEWIEGMHFTGTVMVSRIPMVVQLNPSFDMPLHQGVGAQSAGFYIGDVIRLLFAAGVVIMAGRATMRYLSVQAIKKRSTLVHSCGVHIYDVSSSISPFSFGNAVFVNTSLHAEEELEKILQHEMIHIRQHHTIDIIIAEILCIINWFNPFAWLINRAIRQNLEFIADRNVLETGVDGREYQYLLLKVSGIRKFSLTTNFNISTLKKRIIMINKMKTPAMHLAKFLFVLPLLAVMFLAFRSKQSQSRISINKDSLPYVHKQRQVPDTVPPPPAPPAPVIDNDLDTLAVPPPPPPAPPAPPVTELSKANLPKGVKSIVINSRAVVTFINGSTKTFDLNKPQEKAAFEKEFKVHPAPTPVPPVVVDPQVQGLPTPVVAPASPRRN